jgi:hypothetical protein
MLISGCGKGPTLKVQDVEKGAYAVDFSAAPEDMVGVIYLEQSIESLANTEFTIEAWVKRKRNIATLTGGIFSRSYAQAGILLYVYR